MCTASRWGWSSTTDRNPPRALSPTGQLDATPRLSGQPGEPTQHAQAASLDALSSRVPEPAPLRDGCGRARPDRVVARRRQTLPRAGIVRRPRPRALLRALAGSDGFRPRVGSAAANGPSVGGRNDTRPDATRRSQARAGSLQAPPRELDRDGWCRERRPSSRRSPTPVRDAPPFGRDRGRALTPCGSLVAERVGSPGQAACRRRPRFLSHGSLRRWHHDAQSRITRLGFRSAPPRRVARAAADASGSEGVLTELRSAARSRDTVRARPREGVRRERGLTAFTVRFRPPSGAVHGDRTGDSRSAPVGHDRPVAEWTQPELSGAPHLARRVEPRQSFDRRWLVGRDPRRRPAAPGPRRHSSRSAGRVRPSRNESVARSPAALAPARATTDPERRRHRARADGAPRAARRTPPWDADEFHARRAAPPDQGTIVSVAQSSVRRRGVVRRPWT